MKTHTSEQAVLIGNKSVSNPRDKLVLDEQTLDKLLEAAFVVQEHNRKQEKLDLNLGLKDNPARERGANPPQPTRSALRDDSPTKNTPTLAQIVETQRQIQVRQLDLESAMALVAERILEITRATGAAIGILDGKKVRYRATSGTSTLPLGTEVPVEKVLCPACLRVGQVMQCADINTEILLDVEQCRRRGIRSLIAVPIYHNGEIAGVLELLFSNAQAFTQQDVHSCQLMAGLVTEAFARDDERTWKKSLATERATMLEALEKLKPNLAVLVGNPAKDLNVQNAAAPVAASASSAVCRKCGHELVVEEQFCGKCGSPRLIDDEPLTMQSKVASLWQMQQAKRGATSVIPINGSSEPPVLLPRANPVGQETEPIGLLDEDLLASLHADLEADVLEANLVDTPDESPSELARRITESEPSAESDSDKEEPENAETVPVTSGNEITWSSASKARDFFEQLAAGRNKSALARFWNARRGDIYLAVAVILVAVVIRWGILSNHSVSATAGPNATASHRRPAPDADLSMFDRMLIGLGLAEAPEAPEYRGNPETQVWVDLHTALYYCPGTDLYGKTTKGKYTTQRDAQLDQFEPAYRRACD